MSARARMSCVMRSISSRSIRRLVRLVERLTTKNPEERPEDPEVLTILEELIKHPGN